MFLSKIIRLKPEDWMGLSVVAIVGGSMFLFRQLAIVPRATVGLCAAADAPGFCEPRAVVLWLQYQQAFGWLALALGLTGFFFGRRWAAVLGVAVGIAAIVNYNATQGMIGAALGIITWIGLNTGRYLALM